MSRLLLVLVLSLAVAAAGAAPGAARAAGEPTMTKEQVEIAFRDHPNVASWAKRFPQDTLVSQSIFDAGQRSWRVYLGNDTAGVIADGRVSDDTGAVTEAWAGPQVWWTMARGYPGIFGGTWITSWPVWLGFSLVFLLGLADLRRLLSWRNLDLLVLVSFSLSLLFFNRGDIFTSVPLAYPPLLYLLGRCAWIGWHGRSPEAARPVWPVWAILAATVVLMGVRIGLSAGTGNVIDVGYSSVVGAERIWDGRSPYGHFPVSNKEVCGPLDSHGNQRGRLQSNGRCEVPKVLGDTYGPVVYESYLPGFLLFGWNGQFQDTAAARFTATVFDVACLGLLALLGWRMAGRRLAVTLAFAWAAFPFTLYALGSSTNDAVLPAFLVGGLVLVAYPVARGAAVALSGWSKFASLLLAPLWRSYPDGRTQPKAKALFAAGFVLATALAFWILLLDRTRPRGPRLLRPHDRLPDRPLVTVLDLGLAAVPRLRDPRPALAAARPGGRRRGARGRVYFLPRRKSPLQLAALTGALLIAFEVVMTHWHYLYIPWFFPFVAVAVLAGRPAPVAE